MIDMVELDQMFQCSSSLLVASLDMMNIDRLEINNTNSIFSQKSRNAEW